MEREVTGGVVRTPNGGRQPLAIALIVVAAIAASYSFYSRGQRAYFSSRNLRLLAIVAVDIFKAKQALDAAAIVLR